MRTRGVGYFVALFLLVMTLPVSLLFAEDPVEGTYDDGHPRYNEQGYLGETAHEPRGNISVSDFGGNLTYSRPLYHYDGEADLDLDVALTYNGSVGYNMVNWFQRYSAPPGRSSPIRINAPAWILSVNGICVQILNFQTELYSWFATSFSGFPGAYPDTCLTRDSVALIIDGYHMNVLQRENNTSRNTLTYLLADGSEVTIYDDDPTEDEGYGHGDQKHSLVKAWSEYHVPPIDQQLEKLYWIKPGDGTTIHGRTRPNRWRTGWQQFCQVLVYGAMDLRDTVGVFLPDSIYDGRGNVITFEYLDTLNGYPVYGRPLLSRIELNHDSRRSVDIEYSTNGSNITGIAVGDYELDVYARPDDMVYPSVGDAPNRCYVTGLTDPVGRTTVFEYERYVRGVYDISRTSGRGFSDGNDNCYWNHLTPDSLYPDFYRICTIKEPNAGLVEVQYYKTTAGFDSLDTYANYGAHPNSLPRQVYDDPQSSQYFEGCGRDPFFSNIVTSIRRFTWPEQQLEEPIIISNDSLVYDWWPSHSNSTCYFPADSLFTYHYTDSVESSAVGGSVTRYAFAMLPFWHELHESDGTYETSWQTVLLSELNEFDSTWYYYDVPACQDFRYVNPLRTYRGCDGSLQLTKKTVSRAGTRYDILHSWDTASDLFNIASDTTIGPLGVKSVTVRDESFLAVTGPDDLYFNTNVIERKTIDTTDDRLLTLTEYEYLTSDGPNGYRGQLASVKQHDIVDGVSIGDRTTEYHYYYDDADQGNGNLGLLIGPEGDSTRLFYNLPVGQIGIEDYNLSFDVVSLDGTSSHRYELVDEYGANYARSQRYAAKDGGYIDTLSVFRSYDEFGRPVRLVDNNGSLHIYDYDGIGRVTSVADPYSFEPLATLNDVIERSDLVGHANSYEYDDVAGDGTLAHRSVSTTQKYAVVGDDIEYGELRVRDELDGLNRRTKTDFIRSDDSYDSITYTFDHDDRPEEVLDQIGNAASYEYDELGRLTQIGYPDLVSSTQEISYGTTVLGTLPGSVTQHVQMDCDFLDWKETTDENGNEKTVYSDVEGNRRFIKTNVAGVDYWTVFDYDKSGNLTTVVRPEGDEVQYEYNSLSEVTRELSADYSDILYEYDDRGNLVSRKDGHHTPYTSASQDSLQIEYVAASVDGRFEPYTEFKSSELFGKDGKVHYHLDIDNSNGYQTTVAEIEHRRGGITLATYSIDGCSDPQCSQDGAFDVDSADNVVLFVYHSSVYDPDASVTATAKYFIYTDEFIDWQYFAYDELSRLAIDGTVTHALHEYMEDTLYVAGDTTAICRRFYDQTLSDNSQSRLSLTFQDLYNFGAKYDYDARGRVSTLTDYFGAALDSSDVLPDAQTKYEYDLESSTKAFDIQYEYNLADQITRIDYPDNLSASLHFDLTYSYDDLGRLESIGRIVDGVADPDFFARFTYTPRDEVDTMYLGGYDSIQVVDYTYNERGWLTAINPEIADSGAVADRFRQTIWYYGLADSNWSGYKNGNIVAQKLVFASADSLLWHYEYDEMDRLVQGSAGASSETFTYDKNGNRSTVTTGDNHVWSYIYGPGDNQLETVTLDGVIDYKEYTYDADGNVTWAKHGGGPKNLTYDVFGQLSRVFDLNNSIDNIRFGYSASGLRVWKSFFYEVPCEDSLGDTGIINNLLMMMPPQDPCETTYETVNTYYARGQNGEVLAEYADLDGLPAARYVYADGKRIAMIDSTGSVFYYLNDHLGSAGVLLTSTGMIRDKYKYTPFGDNFQCTAMIGQAYRYTGKPLDEELDLNWYYYGSRYYDPWLGRFLSVDPQRGKYPSWCPYAYVLNNPLRSIDPDGSKVYPMSDGTIQGNLVVAVFKLMALGYFGPDAKQDYEYVDAQSYPTIIHNGVVPDPTDNAGVITDMPDGLTEQRYLTTTGQKTRVEITIEVWQATLYGGITELLNSASHEFLGHGMETRPYIDAADKAFFETKATDVGDNFASMWAFQADLVLWQAQNLDLEPPTPVGTASPETGTSINHTEESVSTK